MTTALYPPSAAVFYDSHWEDADLVLMARIKGIDRQNILQSTISSIAQKVYDLNSGSQVGVTVALVVADVIFDTLQTDARWTKDATGYNFRATIAGTYFPNGDTDYRVEILFTPATGSAFPFVSEISVKNLMSS